MEIIISLFLRLLPLYFLIFIGYYANKKFDIKKEKASKLLIYIISPIIVFYGTYKSDLTISSFSLLILFFFICLTTSIIFLKLGQLFFKKGDMTKNILAFVAGTGNIGYFGLPVVQILFGENSLDSSVMIISGFTLYFSSVGYYLVAKSHYSAKESFQKVLKQPILIAFFIGLAFNKLQINVPVPVEKVIKNFEGMYSILGMMLIGLGLREVKRNHVDLKFILLSFLAKFVVWPLFILGVIALDKNYTHLYDNYIYNILIVMSLVPIASTSVTFATELNVHSDKTVLAVFSSVIFALFYIPLMSGLLIY